MAAQGNFLPVRFWTEVTSKRTKLRGSLTTVADIASVPLRLRLAALNH